MASSASSPAASPTASRNPAQTDVSQNVVTSASSPSPPVSTSPAPITAPESLALVVSNETPIPFTHIFPGEEGNSIDLDKSPNFKEIAKVFGAIGDPKAKRSKRLWGYDPDLTSGVKKHRVNVAKERGFLEYSSTCYILSSDDEEIPHMFIKRNTGPSAMIIASSPTAESPQVAATPVTSPAHSPVHEHAPIDDDSDDPLSVHSSMTLAAFLTYVKNRAFQPESLQPDSSQYVSSPVQSSSFVFDDFSD